MTTHQLAQALLEKDEQAVFFLNVETAEIIRITKIRYNSTGWTPLLSNG